MFRVGVIPVTDSRDFTHSGESGNCFPNLYSVQWMGNDSFSQL